MRFPSGETDGSGNPLGAEAIVRRVPAAASIIERTVPSRFRTATATWRLSGNQLGDVSTGPPASSGRAGPEGYGTIITGPMLSTASFEPSGEKLNPPLVGPCHSSCASPPFRDPTHNLRPRSNASVLPSG